MKADIVFNVAVALLIYFEFQKNHFAKIAIFKLSNQNTCFKVNLLFLIKYPLRKHLFIFCGIASTEANHLHHPMHPFVSDPLTSDRLYFWVQCQHSCIQTRSVSIWTTFETQYFLKNYLRKCEIWGKNLLVPRNCKNWI